MKDLLDDKKGKERKGVDIGMGLGFGMKDEKKESTLFSGKSLMDNSIKDTDKKRLKRRKKEQKQQEDRDHVEDIKDVAGIAIIGGVTASIADSLF